MMYLNYPKAMPIKPFLYLLILIAPSLCFSQESPVVNFHTLDSNILGEERRYWVHAPASYYDGTYSEKSYPVVYLLDAESQFLPFIGVMNSMSNGGNGNFRIPELIVIGIPNTDRFRDLTPTHDSNAEEGSEFFTSGGGEDFLDFIENELIPDVGGKYRTMEHRTLVGHSLGGLAVIQSFIHKPELFQAYMAIDPSLWWGDGMTLAQAENLVEHQSYSNSTLYLVTPEYTNDNYQITSTQKLFEILEPIDVAGFSVTYEKIPGVDHGSVPMLAFYQGLPYIFGELEISIESIVTEGARFITNHFDSLSSKLDADYPPPEKLLETIGLATMELPDTSLSILELNLTLYPESTRARLNLSEVYVSVERYDDAQEILESVLELDPKNEKAQEELARLRNL